MNFISIKNSHSIRANKPNFLGFTLVELIVVITILVILGTIGFMSLSGYSGSARDSSRISDLNNIAKALDITYQKTNSYPLPDNYFNITYSGGNVWHQGNVSEGVIAILNNGGGLKLSKKPTDPLTTSKEYTYSKLSYGYAYQIKANWEGETVASYSPHSVEGDESFFNQAQASTGNPTITYVKGNYNGVVAKTQTGNLIYILAVPSIVTSTGVTYLSSIDMGAPANSLSGTLFIHGGSNTTGVSYNPKLIYASGSLPKTQAEQILFASGIATAYSGTPLATQSSIKPFTMALSSNDTTTLTSLGGGILASALGGVVAPEDPPPGAPPSLGYPSICGAPDIQVGAQYWAACNVGATTVSTAYVAGANDSTIGTETTNGRYFQWGENVAWNYAGGNGAVDNCTWDRDTQACGASALGAWSSSISDNNSGGANRWGDWSMTDTRGPCVSGYHVPTQSEWNTVYTALGSRNALLSTLKLPTAGSRMFMFGTPGGQGSAGAYWTSSPDATVNNTYILSFTSAAVNTTALFARANGVPVRCIKD